MKLGGAAGKFKNWFSRSDAEPRRAPRSLEPKVVVHYWNGAVPEGHNLRDISQSGAYVYTSERWYLGTIVRLVLQGYHTSIKEDGTTAPTNSISVSARVVRQGTDGVGFEFVFRDTEEEEKLRTFLAAIPVQPTAAVATSAVSRQKGQSLIEFILVVPLLFLLAVNALNFGGFIFAWITVANAARAGAQYMVMSSASPGSPTPATAAAIAGLVTNDLLSLLNGAACSTTSGNVCIVAICTNSTKSANACTTFSDPEAPAYKLASVDVTYTYQPLIPLFDFPGLGIHATLPSSNIHRKAVFRMLQ